VNLARPRGSGLATYCDLFADDVVSQNMPWNAIPPSLDRLQRELLGEGARVVAIHGRIWETGAERDIPSSLCASDVCGAANAVDD